MRKILIRSFSSLVLLAAAGGAAAQQAPQPAPAQSDSRWELFDTYCSECHNSTDWAGGVAYDTLTPDDIPREAKLWESTARKLRGHLMPPPGTKQPTQAEKDVLTGWLETSLDANKETPHAGYTPLQRLNRTEYANAVRTLVGIDIKVQDLLPPEIEVDGFDNIAAALTVSPAFLDQYIGAARFIAKQAVGNSQAKQAKTLYPTTTVGADSYIDGFPLGTRGGTSFRHNFPADGEYLINILDLDVGLYPSAAENLQTLVIFVDGKEVFRGNIGGKEDLALVNSQGADGRAKILQRFGNIPVNVKAGSHEVLITFIERARAMSDEYVGGVGGQNGGDFGGFGRLRLARLLNGVEVVGPQKLTGLSMNESRAKIFVCQPQAESEEAACAQKIAENLAHRAFRRPVTAADTAKLMPFFAAGRKEIGTFDGGVQYLVTAVLSSPDFLYRGIRPNAGALHAAYRINDLELASRLSFFLWADLPDTELLSLAEAGRLSDAAVYEAQVRRMLADKRAASLVKVFAMRWLNVDDLNAVDPDPRLFPAFSDQLRRDFSTEIELFLGSVLTEDRSVLELLNGEYSFLNDRMARHYGIDGVFGPQFRKVKMQDPNRHGLLGKSAVLLRTSYGDRTSPVLRGAWVLERLYGTPATPPPPGVETNLDNKPGAKPRTVRARLEQHRSAQACNSCHGVIDPIGLALENFDVTGTWRSRDEAADEPIDASTTLPSGAPINGAVELRKQILSRPEQFVQAMTSKLMMYALGREVEFIDMPQIRSIVRNAAADEYRFSSLVLGIVKSDAFRMQGLPHEGGAHAVTSTLAAAHPPVPADVR